MQTDTSPHLTSNSLWVNRMTEASFAPATELVKRLASGTGSGEAEVSISL